MTAAGIMATASSLVHDFMWRSMFSRVTHAAYFCTYHDWWTWAISYHYMCEGCHIWML